MAITKNRIGTLAMRPAQGDYAGARYLATDLGIEYEWNGGAWIDVSSASAEDVHRSFLSGAMTTTASRVTTSGFPRVSLPAAGTTSVFIGAFEVPLAWFQYGLRCVFGFTNDHSAGGNVRFTTVLRSVNIGLQTLSAATALINSTFTASAPGINGGVGLQPLNNFDPVDIVQGAFGTVFALEITRLGDDAADTLAGPVGITAATFLRADA